jgi:RimJ/RimL family protein N-acetyltransferase
MRFIEFDREEEAEKWARNKLGVKGNPEFFRAMSAVDENGEFVCVAIFSNFTKRNIDMNFVAKDGYWSAPKETLKMYNAIFTYVFKILEAVRATALVGDTNWSSKKFVNKLGFKHEGVMRCAYENNEDLNIFGLLRDEYINHAWSDARAK